MWRAALYAHEIRHVSDFARRSKIDGNNWIFAVPKRADEILFEWGWTIASEYSSERFAGELLADMASRVGGTVTFDTTLGLIRDLETMLTGLGEYLCQNITAFRLRRLNVEGMWGTNARRVASILTLYAYVYSVGETNSEVRAKIAELEQKQDFQRFFARGWSRIHTLLKQYYDEADYVSAKARLQDIASGVGQVLVGCGLRMSDTTDGLWLYVLDIHQNLG